MSHRNATLMLLAVIAMACSSSPDFELPAPGVPADLARERAARLTDIVYELDFRIPDTLTEAIEGRLELAFQITDASLPLAMDFTGQAEGIKILTSDGKPVDAVISNEHIVLPPKVLRRGANRFRIEFRAGDMSLNRSSDYLYTLLVPDRARTAFPCFDQPDLKGRYRLRLEVPFGWAAVGNGQLEELTKGTDTWNYAFRETEPIPTYLFAFAAGRLSSQRREVDGRIMTMYFRESDQQKVDANAEAIFELHGRTLAWLENYTDSPYPFQKFDFVLLPGFQYGGMEHPGCIFYREPSLMLEPAATLNQQLGRARLIAHETAHMWFGDLVTMEWFNDVWLKEVFANFMAAKIVNPSFPEVNHELSFLLSHQPAAYSEDRSAGTHPIQQELENLKDAGTLYGRIIYQKAPVVMHQLEYQLGEEAFREGLREYLSTFAFGNASWDDLITILDRRTDADLAAWSQVWVKEAGMPIYQTDWSSGDGRLEELSITAANSSSSGRLWEAFTQVVLFYSDTLFRIPVTIGEAQRTLLSGIGGYPAPLAILSNGSEMSYGYFMLDRQSLNYLIDNLGMVKDPLIRGAGWMALYEEVLRDRLEAGRLLEAIFRALPTESEALNREQLLGYGQTLFWTFLSREERTAVAPELEASLWRMIQSAADNSSRTAFFRTYQNMAFTADAADRLFKLWSGRLSIRGLPFPEGRRIDLACEAALRLPEKSDQILSQEIKAIQNADRRQRLVFLKPALVADPSVRDSFFNSLRLPENRHYEPWVADGLAYLNHPFRAPESEKYILPSLELMEEIQATGDIFFPRRWITATLSGHQSPAAAAIVRRFLDERPDYPYRLRNKILMAADLLFRAANEEEEKRIERMESD